jgi:hypothetical protein
LNLSAIFSKTGKGVQEASGKTSHLSRADRAVLSAIDGKTALSEVQKHFEKLAGPKFEALIQQLDKDGFIREVSSGAAAAPSARPAPPPSRAAPPPASGGSDDDMDFTQAVKLPPKGPAAAAPKAPPVDLAAAGRAEAERKAKEAGALDYKARQEAETRAKAEAELKARAAQEARLKAEAESRARAAAEEKAREAAEAKGRADAEAKAKAEAETRARAEADSKTRAEADAKVKAAREAAVRMATEAKARAEADAKTKADAAERDKARLEAELNAKLDAERRAREDAERRAAEAAATARKELEEKAKRDADEMRQRLEAEMKAKLDAERKAREEEDRKRREEEDRRRKEEDERRAKEDAERRAREEADRKKREDEERKRREDDERRRREDDERRAKEDAERKKRDEDDRKKRDEEDRRRKDDEARRAKDEAEAKARAAASATSAAASLPKIEAVPPPPPPPAAAAAGGGIGDSLLADLESFGKREEEEQKAKEEAERKAKAEAARRAEEDAERKAKDEAEKKRRDEEARRRKEEDEQRAREETERKAREEEEQRREEEAERKRKAKEAAAAARQAEQRAAKAAAGKKSAPAHAGDDDIGVTDDDLDTDDLKRDQKVAAEKARKVAREQPALAVSAGRPRKWGKPAAIALFVLLIGGLGVLHVMPLSTAEYEKAASEAMGVPVKISSARLSLITGIEVRFEGVSIGDAVKIRVVRGSPEVGSLFGARKSFSRVDLEGVSLSQSQLGDALLGKVAGENFRIGRITAKQLALDGPLKVPPLDLDAAVSGDGSLQSVRLTGADKLSVLLSPRGGEIGFEISAGSLALPFVPALSLAEFGMKGSANRTGVTSSEFDGRAFDGVISGTARIRWDSNWTVDGEVRARGVKVAVFAPTLVSDGKVEGRAAYTMAGSAPAMLYESARLQGEFKIEKGVLGSFDLTRALQTGGAQSGGRTVFNELSGQGVYDKGTVQISNVTISAGAMNAGASLNIDANGGLSGRVVADVKTPSQTLRATLNVSGKVQDPVIRK